MQQRSTLMWEIGFAIGALIVAVGLAWGLSRSRSRNKAADPIRDQATRELYTDPNYDDARRRQLEQEINRRGGP
jgi:hypothetical protein